ncbi:PKD domain-containing protein [Haladaptatus cibarius]|uniref:PKD domain-containing protein n=1 Tax=Haladaptatus cibarius TaxID=453847 RepID=UPI000678FB5F|nr:PKD domain-containing protein [Haladaptatus cibarius]
MNRAVSGVLILLLTTSLVPPTTTANESPLADAGLDQSVTRGATVLLNAQGSYDPDGEIERYEWSITMPDGTTRTPDCETCPRTRFRPNSVGTYTVSLTATDEDGASSRDTLYVSVSPGEKPEVSVSGPQQPRVGEQSVYSADIQTGAAPLHRIVWSVDGETVETQSLSNIDSSDTITQTFANAGSRTITATVSDSDGQTASDSFEIAVQPARTAPSENTLADQYASTIGGDDVVTGSTPLRGSYSLQSTASSSQIDTIRWVGDASTLGSGQTLATNWEPGDHTLYAIVTYVDSSRDVARFSDGSTTVVADPKPVVELSSLDSYTAVSGSAVATDKYENLRSITVRLDGTAIGRLQMDGTPGAMQRRQVSSFDYSDFDSGETCALTVTAVDARGQTNVLEKEVTPTKEPEIIESGFVNGPVDSYHERIDSERYTAHHVVKIDLNGVDPDDVEVASVGMRNGIERVSSNKQVLNNQIVLDSYWVGQSPGTYNITRLIKLNNHANIVDSKLRIKPSPPELRVDVINDGTSGYKGPSWGIVVDAGDSFDPDGTKLKYIWKFGAEPITPDNKTGKFRSVELARLKLEDRYELTTSKEFNYLEEYSPEIDEVKVLSEGPYKPNDTVRLRVTTEPYRFTKNTYHDQFELGVTPVGVSGNVVKWEEQIVSKSGHTPQMDDPRRYIGIIEIEASELANTPEKPKLRVYNEKKVATYEETSIPDLEIYRQYGTVWTNISIKDTKYKVERSTYNWARATSADERDDYLADGYSVVDTERDGFEYTLEERVKVQDAQYEIKSKTFSTKLLHSAFLQTHSDWWSGGRESEKRTQTRTEREWRDSKTGDGTFLDETRRVETEPARYQTQKEYAYEYDVEKTGTRTVTKTREVEVTKTDTMYVMKCGFEGICFEVPKTYTYTTTVERTYTTTEEYTYTVTRTETYWAPQRLGWDHWSTGDQRKVKVSDAEYKTQYLYEYQEEYTDVVHTYEVKTREKVSDAKYAWQERMTTTDRMDVESLISADNWRIGKYGPNLKWDMQEQTGSKTTTVDIHFEGDTVLDTYVTADVDVTQQYVVGETVKNETTGTKTVDKSYSGLVSTAEIKNRLRNQNGEAEEGCKNKLHCIM